MLNARQYGWILTIILFSFIAFAGSRAFCVIASTIRSPESILTSVSNCGHTGGTVVDENGTVFYYFLPWTVLVIFLFFGFLFDVLFTAESSFVFDPNYDNWRRRVDSKY
mmetsp:Transcript_15247/g.35762  ORF Transcript_15247/g.35762 Transcript_15247/m.35762 type:complete len:109 (-) Transcript_15247:218-544(-)